MKMLKTTYLLKLDENLGKSDTGNLASSTGKMALTLEMWCRPGFLLLTPTCARKREEYPHQTFDWQPMYDQTILQLLLCQCLPLYNSVVSTIDVKLD